MKKILAILIFIIGSNNSFSQTKENDLRNSFFYKTIQKKLFYSSNAVNHRMCGFTTLYLHINNEGVIDSSFVYPKLNDTLTNNLFKLINKTPAKWQPEYEHYIVLPLYFVLWDVYLQKYIPIVFTKEMSYQLSKPLKLKNIPFDVLKPIEISQSFSSRPHSLL